MIKTAIFVEGQTELIFVREYLLKMFGYQDVWIECYTLFNDNSFNSTEYPFTNEDAAHYFQVVNVGNDNAVLTRLLNREQYLWNSGFHKILAIRDMYSQNYRETVQNATIQEGVNIQFIEGVQKTIKSKAKQPDNIRFHFAIMETEAWIIGLKDCFTGIDTQLTDDFILEQLNIDLSDDPETAYFHPAQTLADIFSLANRSYTKSADDVNAILGHLTKDNFIKLSESGQCASFRNVHNTLIPN